MHYSLADMILDIVSNSIEAGASLVILDYLENSGKAVVEGEEHGFDRIGKGLEGNGPILQVAISDNGKGMNPETLRKALDPFYTDGEKHKNRKVGLGLPFLKQTVESLGGVFDIRSKEGEGTSVFFEIPTDNIDAPPTGNLSRLFTDVMLYDGEYEMVVQRSLGDKKYSVMRSELLDALGSLFDAESIKLAQAYFAGQEEELLS